VLAGLDHGGQHLELDRGALELAVQPGLGQPGLAAGHADDLVAVSAQPRGGAAEHLGPPGRVGQTWIAGGLGGRGDDRVQLLGGGLSDIRPWTAGAGVDPMQRGGHQR
jgi:hypothetical protein